MDPNDRPSSLNSPLPSEACTVCANLRQMFTDPGFHVLQSRGSLETVLTTKCLGHGPLFDYIRDDLCKKLYGRMSGRNQKHSDESWELWFDTVQHDGGISFSPEISMLRTDTVYSFFWSPMMAGTYNENQKPAFGQVFDPDWVDLELARRWKRDCFAQHGGKCCNPLKVKSVSPAWVIDTAKRCIVPGEEISEYVALSYRWGASAGFRTTRHILKSLQEPGALSQGSRLGDTMAPIIQHAIGLTQAMDERYLWVDSVCIVQDDEAHCIRELGLMGAIYATAKLTIVASDGDADDGILGLKGVSPPRHLDHEVVPVFESEKVILRDWEPFSMPDSPYFRRGWTYQEFYLSQRRLTFAGSRIYWHCSCADWAEDTRFVQLLKDKYIFNLVQGKPDFPTLNALLAEYNGRSLTFPEDALPGISGLLSILSCSFKGGFLFGLPEVAFDSALMWRLGFPGSATQKREDSGSKNLLALTSRLPSWSWVSWKSSGCSVLQEETFRLISYRRSWTIPITQWFTHETPNAVEKRPIQSDWLHLRERFSEIECELPEGWTREKYDKEKHRQPPEGLGLYVYRNAAIGDEYFWLPVPIPTVGQDTDLLCPAQTPYISCNTKRGRFAAARFPAKKSLDHSCTYRGRPVSVVLLDGSGDLCGRLYLQGPDDISRFPEASSGRTCEVDIVAICRRRERDGTENSWLLDSDGELDARMDSSSTPTFKDVYGILWVEWVDGVAYRRASGIIDKDVWENHDLEAIHLVMG